MTEQNDNKDDSKNNREKQAGRQIKATSTDNIHASIY